ncbi:MAG: hypothetical protein NVS4B12_16820 [Ktedonobacteraceae bacterium]
MDVSLTTITLAHLIIVWTLVSVLFVWIFLFALLALRPEKQTRKEAEETFYTPSVTNTQPTTVHTAVAQPALPSTVHNTYETVREVAPLA